MKDIFDLAYLAKLSKSINNLLDLAEQEEDDSLLLDDAREKVKRQIKGLCIDLNIHRDFIESHSRNFK